MNYDVFTIAAVVDELNRLIAGGKVQDSLEIGGDALGLEIYAGHKRHYLLISADQQSARVHLVSDRVRRGVEMPSPLGLLVRRYVEGGRFIRAVQPAWERVIYLDFSGPEGEVTLIAEPMERRGNILLVQGETVLECMRRMGAHENRVRVSLPGQPYTPPPPQVSKIAPHTLTLTMLTQMLDADPGKPGWRLLTEKLLGFSPLLAKEAIFRAMGRWEGLHAGDVSARSLLESIGELITPLLKKQFTPGVCSSEGMMLAFAAYPITHLPGWLAKESISEALSAYYGAPVGEEAYENAKQPIRTQLQEALEKISRRLESLQRQAADESERDRLRMSGELILAYQFQIKKGQTSFSAEYELDAPPLVISLDPALSPLDNAKSYFDRYERAKRAAAEVPALVKAAQRELDVLKQLETDLNLAANYPEIVEVQEALQTNGYWRGPHHTAPRGGKSAPLKINTPEGMIIWVGRNSRQNDEVTFNRGRPEDTWLHARGVPGAHIIIKNGGRPIPQRVLQQAANLAAYYSAARSDGRVLVDVTERRHVRKIKGGKAGMVTYRHEQPMMAIPTAADATTPTH